MDTPIVETAEIPLSVIFPAQCQCGRLFLEKYQFSEPTEAGAVGFAYCGFCRNKVMVYPTSPITHGFCRVPMWMGGLPAGHCNEPAYGPQERGQERYGSYGPGYRGDRWYPGGVFEPGFCSGFACHKHGGPAAPTKEEAAT